MACVSGMSSSAIDFTFPDKVYVGQSINSKLAECGTRKKITLLVREVRDPRCLVKCRFVGRHTDI